MSPSPTRLVALQVVRDALRERVLHVGALYLAAAALLTPWVADLSLAAPTRAVRDLGLTLAWALACAVAIWLGVRAVGWDLRSRTAALLLTRPVPRWKWLAGRILGVQLVLLAEIALLIVAHAAIAALHGAPPTVDLAWFAILLWAEACVLAALAALLGVLVAPALAASFAVALWAAGHLANEYTAATADTPLLATLAFTVVPDLDLFVVQEALVHGDPVDPVRSVGALGYALLWTLALVAATAAIVERTDVA